MKDYDDDYDDDDDDDDDLSKVFYLCSQAHNLEDKFDYAKAKEKFEEAWRISRTDFAKYVASRQLAGYQKSFEAQLEWFLKSLEYGLNIDQEVLKGMLSSHYHDIGECYEELKDYEKAKTNYLLGTKYLEYLGEDKDGRWVIDALYDGIERMTQKGF